MMKKIEVEELKVLQLNMLKDIHVFCKANNIMYSLAFGSLLGAIRHKGYIPWDDDIDIMLRREEYDRFVQLYGNDIYNVTDLSKNSNHGLAFAKVEDTRTFLKEDVNGESSFGVFIDVFPVDHVPDNLFRRKVYYGKKSFWNYLFNLKLIKLRKGRSLLKNIILFIGHFVLIPFSRKFIAYKMEKMTLKYRGSETKYMGIVAPADSRLSEALPAQCFDEYIEVPFEGTRVMVIKDYDVYLRAAYGDYLEMPPKEKQVAHHAFEAFWK